MFVLNKKNRVFKVLFFVSSFQGSLEAGGNSPSPSSTPASPQTKTASEGELSTTAAELLQDYMTTVCVFVCVSGGVCMNYMLHDILSDLLFLTGVVAMYLD